MTTFKKLPTKSNRSQLNTKALAQRAPFWTVQLLNSCYYFHRCSKTPYRAYPQPRQSWFLFAIHLISDFGLDGPIRKDGRMALYMFLTSSPPLRLKKRIGASNLTEENVMKSETLIPFAFNDSPITVVMHNNEPWFIANEICQALDYKNVSQAVADHLDEDERMTVAKCDSQLFGEIMTLSKRYSHSGRRGGAQFLTLISESGMYSLVLRSHKPEAKKFSKWVTREVLPSIRKTGSYSVASSQQQPEFSRMNLEALCNNMLFLAGWWHQYGPAVRKFNKQIAASLHDHFNDGAFVAAGFINKFKLDVASRKYAMNYPFHEDSHTKHLYYLTHSRV